MNIASLLNRRPALLESTTKLTSLVLKNNRQEIQSKSLLLKKRREISKERIKAFARGLVASRESIGEKGVTTSRYERRTD